MSVELLSNDVLVEEENYVMTGEDFGFYLINMRSVIGVTQAKMSEMLGCNQNVYNAYEKGKRLPRKWAEIQRDVQNLVKKHKEENRGIEFKNYIDKDLLEEIVSLHKLGRNNVQIGISLDVDEDVVTSNLIKLGYEPIIFTSGW